MIRHLLVFSILVYTGLNQILPGTVPSLPNPTLEGCLKDTLSTNYTSNYTATYAKVIDNWCQVHDEVLPCVEMSLPYTRLADVNDWYLSMMFDLEFAQNISENMCTSWEEYADQMICVERSRRASSLCMKFQTSHLSTILMRLYYTNETENEYADVNACLYANYTANCMIKHMKYCSDPVRRIIRNYFRLLNGKCDAVLLENALEHKNKTAEITAKRQKFAKQMKSIMEARRRLLNNTTETQTILKDLEAENITTALLDSNTTDVELSGSQISLEQNKTSLVEPKGGKTIAKVTKPSKKRPRKSRKERVKLELKKLLGFVMKSI